MTTDFLAPAFPKNTNPMPAHQAESVALEENLFTKKDFLKKHGSNRLLAERRARVDFKKPWDFVFKLKEKVGLDRIGGQNISAPFGGANASFVFILPLLDKIRTFFKENPDAEF